MVDLNDLQVSKQWREAVDLQVREISPQHLEQDFARRFPSVRVLHLSKSELQQQVKSLCAVLLGLKDLEELSICCAPSFQNDSERERAYVRSIHMTCLAGDTGAFLTRKLSPSLGSAALYFEDL